MSVLSYIMYLILSMLDISFVVFLVLYLVGMLMVPTGRELWNDVISNFSHLHHHS